MKLFYPPNRRDETQTRSLSTTDIFLAGSIEMGKAENWQQKVIDALSDYDVQIFNPRRPDWDSSWDQNPDKGPFKDQVDWELDHISQCEIVIFNFVSGTVSPITLLELGLCMQRHHRSLFVCCPPDYFRYGNVKITCERNGHHVYKNLDGLLENLTQRPTLFLKK
jgi:hypothetical protein